MADLAEQLEFGACRACDTPSACFIARPRPCDAGGSAHRAMEDLAIDPVAVSILARRISEDPLSGL